MGRNSKGIRGQRSDWTGPRSQILAQGHRSWLKARRPAFPGPSEGLSGHCHVYPPAIEAKAVGMEVSSRKECPDGFIVLREVSSFSIALGEREAASCLS